MTRTGNFEGTPRPRARSRRSPALWVAAGFAATLAAGALAFSALAVLAREEIESRLGRLGERLGATISAGRVEVDLSGRVRIEDLRIEGGSGSDLRVLLRAVEARISAKALFGGDRRPRLLEVMGGEVRATADDALLRALRGGGDAEGTAAPRAATPLEVRFADVTADLAMPGLGDRLRLEALHGEVVRDDDGAVRASASGTFAAGERRRRVTGTWTSGESPRLRLAADGPLGLEVRIFGRDVRAQLTSLERTPGETRAEKAAIEAAGLGLGCESLVVADGGGLVPDPASVTSVRCEGVRAREGRRRAEARSWTLSFSAGPDRVRGPSELKIEGPRIEAKAGSAASGSLSAGAREIVLALRPDALERLRTEDLAGAVLALTVRGPALRITTPQEPRIADLPDEGAEPVPGAGAATLELPLPGVGPLRVPEGARAVSLLRDVRLRMDEGSIQLGTPEEPRVLLLDDVSLDVAPESEGGVRAEVSALVVRASGRSGRLEVSAEIDPDGGVRHAEGLVQGADLAHALSRFSSYVTVAPEAWVQIDFDYGFEATPTPVHRAKGQVRFEDFGFEGWRLTHVPVTGIEGRIAYDVAWRPGLSHLDLELPEVEIGEAKLDLRLSLTAPPKEPARFSARAHMADQDCGAVARAVPAALVPRLEGLVLEGRMAFDASLAADLADPYGLEMSVDGDLSRCRVVSLGHHIRLEDLLSADFVHHPIEPERGRLEHVAVGPGTPLWVPSSHIPDFVKAGAIVTEDRGFFGHGGVRWELVARALKLNLDKGRFVYGGSTITQQLVKNLYLTREKTLGRKLEELVLAWQMERILTKDEILTLYLNVIEYGPDLYGLKAASRHYFAKEVWALSPAEAAFLMGLKPWPKQGHRQWVDQTLNAWWTERVRHVMEMMFRRERVITEAEYLAAAPYQVRFRRPDEPLRSDRRYEPPVTPPEDASP